MSETHPYRTIPLQALRPQGLPVPTAPGPESVLAQAGPVHDRLQRPLRDLRISVTDRCNFRCSYCMPKEVFNKDYAYLPHEALLTFEEIARLARQFVAQGVQKIRLTGGEPLLRKNLEALVAQLAALRTPEGQPLDLALTTNGALLARKAQALKDAGLRRLTVSLDGLDDAVFRRMNDVDFPVAAVLEGIAAAQAAGLGPIKVNMVVQRGVNDDQVLPMARHFQGSGVVLRFIEYMDVGATNGWRMEQVLPSATLIQRLRAELPLLPLAASAPGETAQRWGYARPDGTHDTQAGEIGVIGSVTQAFCGSCNRARLSTEGQLYLCLFAHQGYDLRSLLRSTAPTNAADPRDSALAHAIRQIWSQRSDRYSALRNAQPQSPELPNSASGPRRVEMSYIGG